MGIEAGWRKTMKLVDLYETPSSQTELLKKWEASGLLNGLRSKKMKRVLITGSQGFIGSYLTEELLKQGYEVIGVDNFSKYGKLTRPHDKHPNFKLVEGDAKTLPETLMRSGLFYDGIGHKFEIDYIIALAAKIGGISYFHKYAYDLFTENEQILASTFDFAVKLARNVKRMLVLSSSMVYESTMTYPSEEADVDMIGAPLSSYGRQKLVSEWWAKAAHEQYKLPYTIVRPFNCVGVGEEKALGADEITSGNVKLMLSHVLPDLINKVLKGQDPLHILGEGDQIRCYTNGRDIARGIRLAMESENAVNEAFNISNPQPTTVIELAQEVWKQLNPDKPFNYVSDTPFEYDVQKRIPDVSKAKRLLGFETEISLEQSVAEVISYMKAYPHD